MKLKDKMTNREEQTTGKRQEEEREKKEKMNLLKRIYKKNRWERNIEK